MVVGALRTGAPGQGPASFERDDAAQASGATSHAGIWRDLEGFGGVWRDLEGVGDRELRVRGDLMAGVLCLKGLLLFFGGGCIVCLTG
eukprot:2159738-Rhodomonas_salina.2